MASFVETIVALRLGLRIVDELKAFSLIAMQVRPRRPTLYWPSMHAVNPLPLGHIFKRLSPTISANKGICMQIVCKPTAAVMASFVEAIVAALRLGMHIVVEPKAFSLLAMQLHRLAAMLRSTPVQSGASQKGADRLWDPFDAASVDATVDAAVDTSGGWIRTMSGKTAGSGVAQVDEGAGRRASETGDVSIGGVFEGFGANKGTDEETHSKCVAIERRQSGCSSGDAAVNQEGLASLPFSSPANESSAGAVGLGAALRLPSPPPPVRLPLHDCSGASRASWGCGETGTKVCFSH